MQEQPRRRLACDRCSSQKLRCQKRIGSETCLRCQKAVAKCVFSTSVRGQRPNRGKLSAQLFAKGIGMPPGSDVGVESLAELAAGWNADVDMTFSGFEETDDFNDFNIEGERLFADHRTYGQGDSCLQDSGSFLHSASNTIELSSRPPKDNYPKQTSSLLSKTSQTEPRPAFGSQDLSLSHGSLVGIVPRTLQSHHNVENLPTLKTLCLRELSDLSVKLYEHAATVPPMSIWDPSGSFNERELETKHFAVDKTLGLSQAFIDIYPQVLKTALFQDPAQMSLQFVSKSSIHYLRSHNRGLDASSVHLLLSCHSRIIDIYSALFVHIQACIEHGGGPDNTYAPTLRIGSYTPPPSSAIPMQVMLLFHLVTRLSDLAGELVSKIESATQADEEEGHESLSGPQSATGRGDGVALIASCRSMDNRAGAMVKEMDRLKPLLLECAEG